MPDVYSVMHIWSEWTQFNIYAHEDIQNDVIQSLGVSLADIQRSGDIKDFFFVRYADQDGSHIRFRLRWGDEESRMRGTTRFLEAIRRLAQDRKILSATQVPYVREVNRYGGHHCLAACETIFGADSRACIELLSTWNLNDQDDSVLPALSSADLMLSQLGVMDISAKLAFAARAASGFSSEFKFGTRERKAIGQLFRDLRSGGDDRLAVMGRSELMAPMRRMLSKIKEPWERIEPLLVADQAQLYRIRWSILHMRMNRLLGKEHRLQEAILWDLLRRHYLASTSRTPSLVH